MASPGIISARTSVPRLRGERFTPDGQIFTAIYDRESGIIYVGGDFTYFNAETSGNHKRRLYAAAIDTKTNQITDWNPDLSGPVYSLAKIGSNIYMGGQFLGSPKSSGGTSGAINFWTTDGVSASAVADVVATGKTTYNFGGNWQNGHQVVEDGSGGFYLAGSFRRVNGQERFRVAHINSTGGLTSWNPSADDSVNTILKYGDNIYMGGIFQNMSGTARSCFAAVNTSGSLLTWHPSAGGFGTNYGRRIFRDGDNIYLLGSFLSINSVPRHSGAVMNTAGSLLAWNPLTYAYPLWAGVKIGSNIYVGGDISGSTASGAQGSILDKTTALMATPRPLIFDKVVFASTPDGNGGVYVGGTFTNINQTTRNYIAHINSLGEISTWDPSTNGTVRWISKAGDNIYFGGLFTSVSSTSRTRLAAVNTAGSLLAWAPTASASVRTGLIYNDNIYIGGLFTAVNNTTRNRLAAVNTSGSLLSWDPNSNNDVFTIDRIGDDLYVGGAFTSVSGTTRNRLAAINTSGTLLSWDPSASANVFAISTLGSDTYIGGAFTSIALTARAQLAAVNTAGNLLTWNPSTNGFVHAVLATGTNVYIAGSFSAVSAVSRLRLAVVNTSGTLLTWTASTTSASEGTLADLGTSIFVGGNYWWASGGPNRYGVAAINTAGDLQSWAPSCEDAVYCMVADGDNIYMGGYFYNIGGITRYCVAAVNTAGSLLAWNPSTDGNWVAGMSKVGDNIYLGGDFTAIAGAARNYVAAVNTSATATSGLLSWNPSASGTVQSVDSVNGIISIGANSGRTLPQYQVGGTSVDRFFVVANTAGSILTGNVPSPDNTVFTINALGTNVYLGGSFTSLSGTTRNRLAAINTSGALLSWNPSASANVWSMGVFGSNITVGGVFASIASTQVADIATINTVGTLQSFSARYPRPYVIKYSQDGQSLFVGGNFQATTQLSTYTSVDLKGGYPYRFTGNASSTVGSILCLTSDGSGGAYLGGSFTTIRGTLRNYVAHINSSGLVSTWNPNANGNVYAMLRDGSNIYFGGAFTTIGATTRQRIAAVNTAGTLLTWTATLNDDVRAMVRDGSNIYFGGNFFDIGGQARGRLAAINTAGSLLSWAPQAGSNVTAMSIFGSNIYIGGTFSDLGGLPRYGLAAINTAGTLLSWTANVTGSVSTIRAVSADRIYVGGLFSAIGGVSRRSVALLNAAGSPQQWNPGVFVSNNEVLANVFAIGVSGDNVYLAGDFDYVRGRGSIGMFGVWAVGGEQAVGMRNAIVLPVTGQQGTVRSIVGDGYGGLYLGGNFRTVNGTTRHNLAHVDFQGELSGWNPSSSGEVKSLAKIGDNIYIGGYFLYLNNSSYFRRNLAAVNTVGAVTSWDPDAYQGVEQLIAKGTDIYAFGYFPYVGNVPCNGSAVISTSGAISALGAHAGGDVPRIRRAKILNDNIYVVGDFTVTNPAGISGAFLKKSDATNALPNRLTIVPTAAWWGAYAAVPDGSGGLYFGGAFSSVNGQERWGLAHINSSGQISTWNPNIAAGVTNYANPYVWCMAKLGDNIYIGGTFGLVNGVQRQYFAAVNTSGSLLSWNPSANIGGWADSISILGSNIYISGNFSSISGSSQNYLAALDTSGALLSWNPNPSGRVYTLKGSNDNIYLAGNFQNIGGVSRSNLAAVNTSGSLLTWDPSASGNVYGLDLANDNIYICGSFTSIGGVARNYVAAINTSGNLLSWNPSSQNQLGDITVDGDNVYLSGVYGLVAGVQRTGIALINTAGSLQSWGQNIFLDSSFGYSYKPVVSGNNIFIPADAPFMVPQSQRQYMAAVNSSGSLLAWNPSADAYPEAIDAIGDNIYIGGSFTSISSSIRQYLAAINTSGSLLEWAPNVAAPVYCLSAHGANIYFGGFFFGVNGIYRQYLAAVNTSGALLNWNPSASSYVTMIEVHGSNVFIGGNFQRIGIPSRLRAAAVDASGHLTGWDPRPSGGAVYALEVDGANVHLGGSFTLTGTSRNRFAQITADGAPMDLNPNLSDIVTWLEPIANTVYAVGNFTLVNNLSTSRATAIDASSFSNARFSISFTVNPVAAVIADQTFVILGTGTGAYGPIGNIVRLSDNKIINI